MKTIYRVSIIVITLLMMFMADIPFLNNALLTDADAVFGVRRRAVRRGVAVGAAASNSANAAATTQQQAATAQQQSATAQQQSATAQQQAATAQQQAVTPANAPATALPMGTVVNVLPSGCTPKDIGGVEYYYCGGNCYRAVFQGNNLVYVTTQP